MVNTVAPPPPVPGVQVARSAVPRTIYRPGVVVGDSRTGETGKFDGPYFVLRAMERLPWLSSAKLTLVAPSRGV